MSPCNVRRHAIVVKPNTVTPALKLFFDERRKALSKLGRLLEPLIHTSNPLQLLRHRLPAPHLQLLWFVMEENLRSGRLLWKSNVQPIDLDDFSQLTFRVQGNNFFIISFYVDQHDLRRMKLFLVPYLHD